MELKIKELWIKALNSGKYEQARGQLRNQYGFCCLGVLCDLYGKEKNVKWTKKLPFYEFNTRSGVLPRQVIEWAGLTEANPLIHYTRRNPALAELNDTGKTFKQIARIIKKYL